MTSPPGPARDHLTDVFFSDLDIPLSVKAGISGCGFVRATEIQAATLPLLLEGRDVAAQAQTGTGKTAAFLVAIYTRLAGPPAPKRPAGAPRALVVAPTRELALQIQEDARSLGHFLAPRIVTVFGGLDYARQRDQLRAGCDLLIGTPGRLLDYLSQGATRLDHVEAVVIDEADRLFDMGFIDDLRRILRRCPPPWKRHSMLFSATLSWKVMELAYEHMNDAQRIEIRPEQITADRVTQLLFHVGTGEKMTLLAGLLDREGFRPKGADGAVPDRRGMLFVNTKRFAERLVNTLTRRGYRVAALSGDIPQAKRIRILTEFKSGKLPLLVATDVASRGLHVEGVTHVFNVDLPQDPEDYVHRIGRTARAGKAGMAISLACEQYVLSLDAIEKLIGRKIPTEYADDALFRAGSSPHPSEPVVVSGGGSRHVAPTVEDEEEEEPEAPAPLPPPSRAGAAEVAEEDGGEGAFWVREAHGLAETDLPLGPSGPEAAADRPAPKRRRRRRRRKPAGSGPAEGGGPDEGGEARVSSEPAAS